MHEISIYVYVASAFLVAVAQVLLKISADRVYSTRVKEYLNPLVLSGYFLFTISLVVSILAYRYLPLSTAKMLDSTTYIFVAVLGYFLLKEKLKRRQLLGMFIMILGILVFSI